MRSETLITNTQCAAFQAVRGMDRAEPRNLLLESLVVNRRDSFNYSKLLTQILHQITIEIIVQYVLDFQLGRRHG